MKENTKKATFNLSPRVLAGLEDAVAAKAAPSKNALVERALVRELSEIRRQARRAQWEEGSRDELLLRDIADLDAAFQSADAETAGSAD